MITVTVDQLDAVAALVPDPPNGTERPTSSRRTTASTHDRDHNLTRFRAYLAKIPGAVWGDHGNTATYKAACCARDFGLAETDAGAEMASWNLTCSPPWPDDELRKVIAHAYRYAKGSAGSKLAGDRAGWRAASPAPVADVAGGSGADAGTAGPEVEPGPDPAPAVDTASLDPVPPPPRWQRADAVVADPPPEAIIDGLVWANSLTVLVGESGSSKTFVLLDLAAAVSAGLPWLRRGVLEGSVVYVGFEGHVGLRLRALREVGGHGLNRVYVIRASDPLSPTIDRDRAETPSRGELDAIRDLAQIAAHVAEAGLPPVRLVIIDTIRASLSGSEDSSEAASAYLRAVRRIMAHVPGAGCVLAHHSGWQDGEAKRKRERGSSAFRANVDGTLYLEAGKYDRESREARLTLTSIKVRDGEARPALHMVRKQVELPGLADRWGQPMTSCIIVPDTRTHEDLEAEQTAAVDASTRGLDLKVLAIIATRPDLTSQEGIRLALGVARPIFGQVLARLVTGGWVLPPVRQRRPYTITTTGLTALSEVSS